MPPGDFDSDEMCIIGEPYYDSTTFPNAATSSNIATDLEYSLPHVNDPPPLLDGIPPSDECAICMEKPRDYILCHDTMAHNVCCNACAHELKRTDSPCPVCRLPIRAILKLVIS